MFIRLIMQSLSFGGEALRISLVQARFHVLQMEFEFDNQLGRLCEIVSQQTLRMVVIEKDRMFTIPSPDANLVLN